MFIYQKVANHFAEIAMVLNRCQSKCDRLVIRMLDLDVRNQPLMVGEYLIDEG